MAAAELAAAQQALGHEIEFACRGGRGLERRIAAMGLTRATGLKLHRSMLGDMRELRRRVLAGIDVIHCHLGPDHMLAFAALGKRGRPGMPLLARTLHRGLTIAPGPVRRRLLKAAADLYIVPSRADRERAVAAGIAPEAVACVRGAVDLERFRPGLDGARLRAEWGIEANAPALGTVSRMRRGRGQFDLLEAFAEVVRKIPNARWIVAGSGSEQALFKERLAGRPEAASIVFIGHRKDDLPEAYAAMDVCVVPAPGSDGSCRAALEAMACGRPVVAMARGALADIVEDGKTGWLAENTTQLAEALIEALGKKSQAMRTNARQRVESGYTQQHRAEATIAAYKQARR